MNELRDEIELPSFDWARMAEVAADELCTPEEHPDHEACMACLAIKGTRWTLEMRKQLESSLAANREQKAEIERLKDELLDGYESSTIANWRSQQIAAAKEAGVHFTEPGIACTNTRAEKAEAELASLRASAGEKPEDAYARGFDAGYERARAQATGRATLATRRYVAPPTLPGEEK